MLSIYFKEQEKLENEFGWKSVILWENGSFMEVYELDTKNKKIGKCEIISKDLNMLVSLQNKKEPHSTKNCKMLGFPSVSLSKNLDVLLKNGWTVSIWNQYDIKGNAKKERKHFKTFTSTINLSDNENLKLNNLMSLYLYNYICPIDKIEKNDLNINILDLNTGKIDSFIFNNKIDITYNQLNEIINKYEINEVIYLSNNDNINISKIINDNQIKIYKIENNESFKNVNYQKCFIEKYFKEINTIETIFLNYPDIVYSLINLLNFVSKCDSEILDKLKTPELTINKYTTIINYDTIYQLNLINNEYNNKYKSIYNLIDNCITLMGKRLLKQRLLNPINDINELNLRYKKIEVLKDNDIYKDFSNYLKNIMDIERIFRIISLKRCNLLKFASFILSIKNAYKLLRKIQKNKQLRELFLINNVNIVNDVEVINNYLENSINIDILQKYNLTNIKENFFKDDNDLEINDIINDIKTSRQKIENIVEDLIKKDEEKKDWVKILQTEKEGYYLFTSKVRYDKLISDKVIINKYKFSTVKLSNGIKFYNDEIKDASNNIIEKTDLLSNKIKTKYINFIYNFANEYEEKIVNLINIIADIDVAYSNVISSVMYNFKKPDIEKDNNIKIKAKGLRHLLIELYNQEEKYIANDVSLDDIDNLGYLILAPNSCGKSSYLRSVGIALVLAQMGSYVPAKEFKFNPYNKIWCKISSIDNIYESKSKFIQDIIHMDMFINNADNKTIVLVDEFLNSTEEYSAAALTATSIEYLIEKNTSFIYTSHINSIINLIKENKKIVIKHFSYIIKNDKIIFERELRDGPPDSYLYGIEISQHIINNKLFLNKAFELRNTLLKKNNNLLNTKFSHFNKKKIVDQCNLCKSEIELETHHKIEQYTANEYGIIITEDNIFHKDNKHNLQILCKNCHKKIHY